jgi:hypothetical protein
MTRNSIAAAWLAGLFLALVILLAGATPLWLAVQEGLDWLNYTFMSLSEPAVLVLRAAAIGLAFTAILLARAATSRGVPVRGVLGGAIVLWVIVVIAFQGGSQGLRWGLATLIALAATLALSRRTV